jgi:hypothetical protein
MMQDLLSAVGYVLGLFGIIVAALILYMLPTFVALFRNTYNTGTVIVINIFLGWSLLGWVAALALSFSEKRHTHTPAKR